MLLFAVASGARGALGLGLGCSTFGGAAVRLGLAVAASTVLRGSGTGGEGKRGTGEQGGK